MWGCLINLRKRPLQKYETSMFLFDALNSSIIPNPVTHLNFMCSILYKKKKKEALFSALLQKYAALSHFLSLEQER